MKKKYNNVKYRTFIISIDIFFYCSYPTTKPIAVRNKIVVILLSVIFTIISILLSWPGMFTILPWNRFITTWRAIFTNLEGGLDVTTETLNSAYDDKTNFIWDNISGETQKYLCKDDLQIVVEIQQDYIELKKDLYKENNTDYIIENLKKVGIDSISMKVLYDIYEVMRFYQKNEK